MQGTTTAMKWGNPMSRDIEDVVNQPSHYTAGDIECIDALKASMPHEQFLGYLKAAAIKYLWRYEMKGKPVQDLRKSIWYTKRLIMELEINH